MKAQGVGSFHLLLDALDERIDISSCGSTGVDDEVGVESGDFGTADAIAL